MSNPLTFPPILFGSSALGNLYEVVTDDTKRSIVKNWVRHQEKPLIDSAGKYGAGLALENLGRFLGELDVHPDDILISNKLGWKRVPLQSEEPTFEPGAWFGLQNDAEQDISYDGILECYDQGNELLGDYSAKLLSIHDPDEYLASAASDTAREQRYTEVREAYRALGELRESREVAGIGVGSKDWRIIQRLHHDGIPLDWVMFANSFTIYSHPPEVMAFMAELHKAGIHIVNSAVFNAGFLTGGKFFDYEVISPTTHPKPFAWRARFLSLCIEHMQNPAHVCCQFAMTPPGVCALALNTSKPERVADNVRYVNEPIPEAFWNDLRRHDLLEPDYPITP